MLGGLGSVSLLFYLAANFLIPQSPRYMAHSSAVLIQRLALWSAISRLPVPDLHTALAVISIGTATTVFTLICYTLALWLSRRAGVNPVNLGIVLGFPLLFFATSFLTLPNNTFDLYSYILWARVFNVYRANPYLTPPATFGNDPYLPFADPSWNQVTVPYGPVWTYLSVLWQGWAGEDIVGNLLSLRALLVGFNLANVALIWKILSRLNPAYRLTGLVFYAWNPIVVLKGQKHVEPVMVFFLLLSVYLYITDREWHALMALTLSALTKFVTAPLLIVYLFFLWRNRSVRVAAIGAGLVAALVILTFLPVWEGWEMVLRLASDPGTTRPGSLFTRRRLLFSPGFLVTILWTSWQGRGTIDDMLRGWGIVLLWFSLFLMPTTYAWYLLSLIAIVALVDSANITAMTVTLCFSALLTNMLGLVAKPYASLPIELFRVIWWGPPFLTLVWIYRAHLGTMLLSMRRHMPASRKSPLSQ